MTRKCHDHRPRSNTMITTTIQHYYHSYDHIQLSPTMITATIADYGHSKQSQTTITVNPRKHEQKIQEHYQITANSSKNKLKQYKSIPYSQFCNHVRVLKESNEIIKRANPNQNLRSSMSGFTQVANT